MPSDAGSYPGSIEGNPPDGAMVVIAASIPPK